MRLLETVLAPHGSVKTRSWGDVISIELNSFDQGETAFSFQIAHRSARLAQPVPAPWPENILIDAIPDLVASKMVALVERGAPRDFRDIYALCQVGLTNAGECWHLWKQRQRSSGSDDDSQRARLAVQTHLARVEMHRPLGSIMDASEREAAKSVREWFNKDFLNALLD